VTIETSSRSDDWIYYALRLQPILITINYKAIADLHNLQLAVAPALGISVSVLHGTSLYSLISSIAFN
jgi:hypothetical protein